MRMVEKLNEKVKDDDDELSTYSSRFSSVFNRSFCFSMLGLVLVLEKYRLP